MKKNHPKANPSQEPFFRFSWGMIRMLGSLRLAMMLFIVIIIACAIGTLYESRFDARVARHYVYDAPWFILWLVFLCLNLACAALTRLPWKRRHAGFVTVHAGIIIILAGSIIGQIWGIEGTMNLRVGMPPENRLVVHDLVMTFRDPGDGQTYRYPFPVDLSHPRPERTRTIHYPSGWGKMVFDGYSEDLLEIRHLEDGRGGDGLSLTGVELEMSSGMMGQSFSIVLHNGAADSQEFNLFNLARMRLVTDWLPVRDPSSPEMQIRVTEDNQISYRVSSSAAGIREGIWTEGLPPIRPGWADWSIRVVRATDDGHVETTLEEVDDSLEAQIRGKMLMTGVRGWLEDNEGNRSDTQWWLAGEPHTIAFGDTSHSFAFGWRTERLPFLVSLKAFDVPRDEGTTNPADFRSDLVFSDFQGNPQHEDYCSMNRPALYPPGFDRLLTGFTWKFSQASWDPEDLSRSTVQVLRDPGWLLKWTGSIVLCTGIFMIFYLKPYRNRRPEDFIDQELNPKHSKESPKTEENVPV